MASRTPKRNAGGRFQRCVAAVSKRRGVVSPRGVCAAAGRKKYGAKKFAAMAAAGKRKARKNAGKRKTTKPAPGVNYIINPLPRGEGYELRYKDGPGSTVLGTFDTYAEANAARAADWARRKTNAGKKKPTAKMVKVMGIVVREGTKKHARLLAIKKHADDLQRNAGRPKSAGGVNRKVRRAKKAGATAKADYQAKRSYKRAYQTPGRGLHTNKGRKPARRKNSLEAAKSVYVKFHGRPAEKILDISEKMHVHDHLSGIGDLVGMQILQPNGLAKVTLKFDDGTVLAQNEKRNQLFIRGGDQSVNLKDFRITGPHHEMEVLGQLIWISYFTRKDHLAPEDGGEAIYKHRFGRKKPTLIYDTVNKKMELAGGGYDIPDEGIDK